MGRNQQDRNRIQELYDKQDEDFQIIKRLQSELEQAKKIATELVNDKLNPTVEELCLSEENRRLKEAVGEAISGMSTAIAIFNSPQMDNSHYRKSINKVREVQKALIAKQAKDGE